MTRKVYRTAQGRMVDLGALQLQNENVRAVGNMKVNARGDLIDSQGQPIDSRTQQVKKQYRRQTSNVSDEPVSRKNSQTAELESKPKSIQESPNSVAVPIASEEAPVTGLAAAIARARQIKQEPLRTPQDIANHNTGISKI